MTDDTVSRYDGHILFNALRRALVKQVHRYIIVAFVTCNGGVEKLIVAVLALKFQIVEQPAVHLLGFLRGADLVLKLAYPAAQLGVFRRNAVKLGKI